MRTSSWYRYEQSDRVCLPKVHRAPVGLDSFDEAINPRYCRDVGFDGLYPDPQIGNASDDFSITNAILLILTLFTTDIALSYVKRRWPRVAYVINGVRTVFVGRGIYDDAALRGCRMQRDDFMEAARSEEGTESVDQIKFAILEVSGSISIIKNP